MADEVVRFFQTQTKPIKLLKWKVRLGYTVSVGRIIFTYQFCDSEKPEQRKSKASQAGIISKFLAQEGDILNSGEPMYEMKSCTHPTIMNDMCAECGADLRKDEKSVSTASVPMVHSIPNLKVSEEQAQKLGKADNERLIRDRKLVLLVDLDQTLIHTTNDNIPPNIKDVYHFQLYGPRSPWYHTRLRPGTHGFLNSICKYYELHICTFGARNYAHTIAMFLDPEQKFFSNRILSRDECFDPTSKKANLRALFPCGDDMVCIIDDREDVWSHALNLIHVKPYHFFQHTGDINAPPGLDKHEDDDKVGVDLTKVVHSSEEKNITDITSEIEQTNDQVKQNGIKEDEKETEDSVECDKVNGDIKSTENNLEEVSNIDLEITNNDGTEKAQDSDTKEEDSKQNDVSEEIKDEPELNSENQNVDSNTIVNKDETSKEINGKLKSITTDAEKDDNLIVIEDPDDYLVYLEDILIRIHRAFYQEFDQMQSGKIPDLKKIIPDVRNSVLKGVKIVFSGLVPTRCKLHESKAYQVARSLGAEVTQDLEDDTTHLVAVRPGTVKVNAGRRRKNIKIVSPEWLWCCAERWEHVDERVFPVTNKGSKNRHPPPHCSSPEHVTDYPEHDTPALRKRTPSGRFMDTINPLMSFSSDDIADMDKEVEDILDDESENSEEEIVLSNQAEDIEESDESENSVKLKHMIQTDILDNYDKDTEDLPSNGSSTDEESPEDISKSKSCRKRRRSKLIAGEDEISSTKRTRQLEDESSQDDEMPSVRFRRGEEVDNELDIDPVQDPDDQDSDSFEAPDESDDGEWNMMGAALEREFLSD